VLFIPKYQDFYTKASMKILVNFAPVINYVFSLQLKFVKPHCLFIITDVEGMGAA